MANKHKADSPHGTGAKRAKTEETAATVGASTVSSGTASSGVAASGATTPWNGDELWDRLWRLRTQGDAAAENARRCWEDAKQSHTCAVNAAEEARSYL